MDQAIWATWYDLPTEGRDAHLAWVHNSYIRQVLKRPGILYAAHYASAHVPPRSRLKHTDDQAVAKAGTDFVLLFGGETAHAFSNPGPDKYNAGLPDEDRKMLAMRVGERASIFLEVARVEGPATKKPGGELAPGPCIQIGSFGSGVADDGEILEFYTQVRMPEMATVPGCIRMRKLIAATGWARNGCLYEFESLAGHKNMASRTQSASGKAWTDDLIPKFKHAPGTPIVANRIWPPLN